MITILFSFSSVTCVSYSAEDYEDPKGLSDAIVAIQKLLKVIKESKAGTIARLRDEIKLATEELSSAKTSTISVSSGSELFLRFITLTSLEQTASCEKIFSLLMYIYILLCHH